MDETKILPATWKTALSQLLNLKSETGKPPRIAVLGVGNEMRCDDAAGVLVARALFQRECVTHADRVLIIEGGHAPENRTGELRRFAPDAVLIIDAADMGEEPGTIQWIAEESIDGMSASTHSLPLSMLARYLVLELNCTVKLLGIQLGSNDVGQRVSPPVLRAVDEIADELATRICSVN
jgi:hydrogenase 3 maturation protease